jgi:hypothetical protein
MHIKNIDAPDVRSTGWLECRFIIPIKVIAILMQFAFWHNAYKKVRLMGRRKKFLDTKQMPLGEQKILDGIQGSV